MNEKVILKYVGNGSMVGVPARDLTKKDLDDMVWMNWNAEMLVSTGLYDYEHKPEIKPVTRKYKQDDEVKND
jgi:hypothetical protein